PPRRSSRSATGRYWAGRRRRICRMASLSRSRKPGTYRTSKSRNNSRARLRRFSPPGCVKASPKPSFRGARSGEPGIHNHTSGIMDSGPRPLASAGMTVEGPQGPRVLLHVVAVARNGVDHCDLLDREVGNDLRAFLMHDEHFLDAHAIAEFLS